MNFFKQSLLYVILSTILLILLISRFAMKNGKPHCDNFIVNVYLYIALSFSLIGLYIHFFNKFLSKPSEVDKLIPFYDAYTHSFPSMLFYVLFLVVSFGSLIALVTRSVFSKDGFLTNHILWIVFIGTLALLTYPFFKSKEYSHLIGYAIYMTSIVFTVMSAVVYAYPTFFEKTYTTAMMALLIGLISIIILELIFIFTNSYNESINRFMFYFILIVFSFLVSYDTSRMFTYAKQCIHSPNYPKISTSQTLNIINLFQNFLVHSR